MRLARTADLRRRLSERNRNAAPCIRRFRLENLPGIGDVDLAPETGFLAICGGTGLGKSALLEAMRLAAEPVAAGTRYGSERVEGATITLGIEYQGQYYERTSTGGDKTAEDNDGFPRGTAFVGLPERTSDLQDFFRSSDIEVLKEDVEPIG